MNDQTPKPDIDWVGMIVIGTLIVAVCIAASIYGDVILHRVDP